MFHRGLPAVRAASTACDGAAAQCFRHDLLDGARAATALSTTAKTSIHLTGRTRQIGCGGHRVADVMVTEDVTGTNNHGDEQLGERMLSGYLSVAADAKGKAAVSSNSKLLFRSTK
jgi:hypothetical protein